MSEAEGSVVSITDDVASKYGVKIGDYVQVGHGVGRTPRDDLVDEVDIGRVQVRGAWTQAKLSTIYYTHSISIQCSFSTHSA